MMRCLKNGKMQGQVLRGRNRDKLNNKKYKRNNNNKNLKKSLSMD